MNVGWRRAVSLVAGLATLALIPVVSVLTIPRLQEPSTGRGVELAALTPWGLPASALLAVVALVLTTFARRWWRALAGFVVAMGVLAFVAHAVWLAPLFHGSSATAASGSSGQPAPIVVMTQNLEYGDAASLDDVVSANAVDILVLADLTPAGRSAVLGSSVPARLPFCVGKDGGSLVLSRYPLDGDRFISGGGDSRELTVSTPTAGLVDLVALHPTPPYQGDKWRNDYEDIIDRLTASGHERPDRPRVILGDFNATVDNVPMRKILTLGYSDAVEQTNAGWQPTYPAPGAERRFGLPVPPLVQIDHVLVSAGIVASDARTVVVKGADHLGVIANVGPALMK